jgi:carbon-monoxide dehydrogenase small subunit
VKIEKIGVSVNGVWQTLELDPEKRLVDVLREDLHLTGTKRGCDGGQCGACSVLIQGKLRRSCTVPTLFRRRLSRRGQFNVAFARQE